MKLSCSYEIYLASSFNIGNADSRLFKNNKLRRFDKINIGQRLILSLNYNQLINPIIFLKENIICISRRFYSTTPFSLLIKICMEFSPR